MNPSSSACTSRCILKLQKVGYGRSSDVKTCAKLIYINISAFFFSKSYSMQIQTLQNMGTEPILISMWIYCFISSGCLTREICNTATKPILWLESAILLLFRRNVKKKKRFTIWFYYSLSLKTIVIISKPILLLFWAIAILFFQNEFITFCYCRVCEVIYTDSLPYILQMPVHIPIRVCTECTVQRKTFNHEFSVIVWVSTL